MEGLFEGVSLVAVVVGLVGSVGLIVGVRRGRRRDASHVVGPAAVVDPTPHAPSPVSQPEPEPAAVTGRLARTRNVLASALAELVGAGLDDAAWERLEEVLITADVGVQAAGALIAEVRRAAREQGVRDVGGVRALLRDALIAELAAGERELGRRDGDGPTVWFVTGVNGAGKTTTIGKLAARERAAGRRVVLAAADTFRAAAAEQLQTWADRAG